MSRLPPMSTRPYTPLPYTTLVPSPRLPTPAPPRAKNPGLSRAFSRSFSRAPPNRTPPLPILPDGGADIPCIPVMAGGEDGLPNMPPRMGGEGGSVMAGRSEEHTSELQSLMRISYAVFCLKKKKKTYKYIMKQTYEY